MMTTLTRTLSTLILSSILATGGAPNMPRGYPDGGATDYGRAAQIADLGEVATRLLMGGGTASRTGRMVWATGFENGKLSDFSYGGSLTAVKAGTDLQALGFTAWQGTYCLVLQTGSILNDVSNMFKYFPATMQTGKWAIEAMVDLEASNATFDVSMSKIGPNILSAPTQKGVIRVAIGGNSGNVKLQYKDSAGVFQQFADIGGVIALATGVYYNVKWVVDIENDNYGRFYWNNTLYDLSAFPLQHTASGVDEKSNFGLVLTNTGVISNAAAIDNVIITSDEP